MKCLVTGGCGFIGSHIVDRLIEDGHEVIVIDNLSAEQHDQFYFNSKSEFHEKDITNYDEIEHLFRDVDVVFHLAAESRIQPCIKNPPQAFQTNIMGTANVLEASRKHGVKQVIYSSTSSAYGNSIPPHKESMRPDCLNAYSTSKVAGEDLCRLYSRAYNLPTTVFRYFNVYGERQPLKGRYAPVIGIFLRQFKNNEPLTIVGDGTQKRDFTHVSDIVEANIQAMKQPLILKWNHSRLFNVGTGNNTSILDLVNDFKPAPFEFIEARPGEAKESAADVDQIREGLNWQATVNVHDWLRKEITKIRRDFYTPML